MNPFRDLIVASPWEANAVDVPAIHGRVFDECLHGIEQVRGSRRSAGLLIHGEAGSGKTHLLRKLRARLAPQGPTDTSRPECLYVYVRLQTSPRMVWRTLRRTLVEDWFRPVAGGQTQFQRILFHRLAEARPAEGDLELWHEYMLDNEPDALAALMDEITARIDVDRNTAVAFSHLAFGRHLRDLRAWLGGASLPEAVLDRLELTQNDGTDEEREDESRQVAIMLCRLAGGGLPVVISFDQVEALQSAPGDKEALFSFGQLVSTLHDATSNVLLITSVQSGLAQEFADSPRQADHHRMTSLGKLSLDPLNLDQARLLIAARRHAASRMPIHISAHDSSWPLQPGELERWLPAAGVSARRLLTLCAERFDACTSASPTGEGGSGPPPELRAPPSKPSVAEFLAARWESTVERRRAESSPDRTEEIVLHGFLKLVPLLDPGAEQVRDDTLKDVSLLFERPGGRSGVSVCTQSNMVSLAARLRRLKTQQASGRLVRLVLIRDARVPISTKAVACRQHLEDLERQGVAVMYPSIEVLAALDALRELLSDALSGDLACEGRTVAPQTVAEWLRAQLPDAVRDFARDVLGGTIQNPAPSDTEAIEALQGLLAETPMLSLQEAARALQRSHDELAGVVRRNSAHFGILGASPDVIFRLVESPACP